MSYTPQPNSLAGRVVAHFRANSKCRELTEAQIAEQFTAPLSSVTACLAASVQYKLLDRVRCENNRMGYAPGRKLHGSNEADKQGLVAPPAVAPAPARKAPPAAATKTPAAAPVPAPAPMAAAVRTLMAQPPVADPAGPSCTCPSGDGSLRWPCPVHPPGGKTLLSRLPDPTALQIEPDLEEEMAEAVAAYDSLLQQVKVGYVLTVPADVANDVYAVCKAWGKHHGVTFTWARVAANSTTMRIKRVA